MKLSHWEPCTQAGPEGDSMMRWLCGVALYAAALAWMSGGYVQAGAADATGKVARIAFVVPNPSSNARMFAALRDRLRELGWIEGQNLILDQYSGEGHLERLPELMAQALARSPTFWSPVARRGLSQPRRRPAPSPSWSPRWAIRCRRVWCRTWPGPGETSLRSPRAT